MNNPALNECRTLLYVKDDPSGQPYVWRTIWFEGKWWLVVTWIVSVPTGDQTPERLVLLSGLNYLEVNHPDYRFELQFRMPKAVLDGKAQEGYVLTMYPASRLYTRTPGYSH